MYICLVQYTASVVFVSDRPGTGVVQGHCHGNHDLERYSKFPAQRVDGQAGKSKAADSKKGRKKRASSRSPAARHKSTEPGEVPKKRRKKAQSTQDHLHASK
jgi:hypothetical protein